MTVILSLDCGTNSPRGGPELKDENSSQLLIGCLQSDFTSSLFDEASGPMLRLPNIFY